MRMSRALRTMQYTVLILCFALMNGVASETTTAVDSDVTQALEANLAQGHSTLNDMFREVEKLMEDTQHKLEEAVHKMDNESARSILYARDLPLNYRDENRNVRKLTNQSVNTVEKIDKVADNITGETHFSRTLIQSSSRGNAVDYACIIDEDCEKDRYCLYEMLHSRCLPCKPQHAPCSKDEECCTGQLCVWGQCSENTTKGEAGSICQYQSDCSTELCCAFHKALLFPVCTPKPTEREHCHIHPNQLMELLSWDIDGEGPREHCPCARGLQCQPHGRGSLCLRA